MAGPKKKVCLLTGASGRLGSAFCRAFGRRYHVAAVYRSNPPCPCQDRWLVDPLAPRAAVPENAGAVFAVQADLAEDGDLDRVVEVVLARFGRIDVLVNAAAYSFWSPVLETEDFADHLNWHFHVNVTVPAKLAALVAHRFWRHREGENRHWNRNLINVSSTAGLHAYPGLGQAAYGASKAALNHLTRHLADEFGPLGVRVNALAPNSFPAIVSTETAAQGIARLAEGSMNGKILVLDRDGEQLL